jgi:single-strand DNA-binding protein
MAGFNKVVLIGYLGADPEFKSTPSGVAVANIRIATNDSQNPANPQRPDWHLIALFDRVAELARTDLETGDLVFIEGRVRTLKWEDRGGRTRYSTEVVGDLVQLLERAKDR